MPLEIPSRSAVARSLQTYVRASVPELDPSPQRRSLIGGLVKSCASALHDWFVALKDFADNQPWPQKATASFFPTGWWVDITRLPRLPAAAAQGRIAVTGAEGTLVPVGTPWTANGITYTSTQDVTIATQQLAGVSSIVSADRARFETPGPHDLATGQTLTFTGCVDAALNGSFSIEVMDATTIEYDVFGAGGAPLEPNPRATGTWASVTVTAGVTGPSGNLGTAATLGLAGSVAGLDTLAAVTFEGVADGSDIETLESWRRRVLAALGTDFGTFSADEIAIVARTVPGVTRVFVRKPTRVPTDGYPLEGQVRVSFLREHDSDPIPSALEVSQVRAALSGIIPAHMVPEDCEVLAPQRYALNVRFRSISPDTGGMRAAITASLRQYLTEEATWGGTLPIEGLRCAIRAAYDARTGVRLARYELDSPTTDIMLPADAYPVLASVTWRS